MNFADVSNFLTAELGPEITHRVIVAMRNHAAGEVIYIPSRQPRPVVTEKDTPKSLMRKGIPRRTAYKWISGK